MRRASCPLCVALAMLAVVSAPFAVDLAPRHIRSKPKVSRVVQGFRSDLLIVKFTDTARVRLREGRLISMSNAPVEEANNLTTDAPGLALSRLFLRPEAQLDFDRERGQIRTGQALADLNAYYVIRLDEADTARAKALLDALNALDIVEIAYAEPILEPAAIHLTREGPTEKRETLGGTPDFSDLQDYHDPAPLGIDVAAAWAHAGGRGEGVRIIDVERRFRWQHEDMPTPFFEMGPDFPSDHGCAVLGELAAPDNGFGVVGIVHLAEVGSYSVMDLPSATVFDQTAASLAPGDFFVIEMHAFGPASGGGINYLPVEYFQADFDAIQLATANGVIAVAAAGNGGNDLDDPLYEGLFDRSVRDSGAILVGATVGGSLTPAAWSNHGTRVDLSGWGEDVVTTCYGDLWGSEPNNEYTDSFAGTSSATPIVTGALAAFQGIYRSTSGDVPLPGRTLADLLIATGTATAGPLLVGPRPDLAQAIPSMQAGLSDLSGTVRDDTTSSPIEGSLVRVLENGAQALTASDGTWSLRLVPGTWTVRATKFGYAPSEYQVSLLAGELDDRFIDLTALPTVSVTGVVADVGGDPLESVEVRIADTPLAPVMTDAGGNYSIPGVPVPFDGVMHASLAEYSPDSREVSTTLPEPAPIDFRLSVAQFAFELDDGGFTGILDWEWGTPTLPEGPMCHGGSRCWGTDLDGTYNPSQDHQLTFTVDVPVSATRLAYWHWYQIWGPYDGINVSVSTDGGSNYQPLQPVGGYPENCLVQLGDPCGPGWTAQSSGWVPGVHDLTAYAGQSVEIRFLVGSAGPGTSLGWYIDDLSVYQDTSVSVSIDTVCIEVDVPAGEDPDLLLHDPADCPTGVLLTNIDLISGDLDDVASEGILITLGHVTIIACDADSRGYLVETVTPPEGKVTFYLAKKTGNFDYGTSTSGLRRVPDSGDCP